ncbi:hypothetical protein EYF80_034466 [Liparis tanakae]|uniref:Uncharacterized protein n=1 Tax=Liparis tanakae TaxID=230148 RepID=A0A4Z2GRP4_9TELE|nr:hypothetical protein EYF80_034466 [Liparis tanakae]
MVVHNLFGHQGSEPSEEVAPAIKQQNLQFTAVLLAGVLAVAMYPAISVAVAVAMSVAISVAISLLSVLAMLAVLMSG